MEQDARLRCASDIMTRKVYALTPDMPAQEAILALVRQGYSGAPVVDRDQRLVGIVSEHDLIRTLAAAAFDASPLPTVQALMTADVSTAEPHTDIFQLAAMLERAGVRRLPIISEGRIVGLVTCHDVAVALAEIGAERSAEKTLGTMDAMGRLEEIHNPFPSDNGLE